MNEDLTVVMHKMWIMVIIMFLSAFCCFGLGYFFAKREEKLEAAISQAREKDYGLIFGDDGLEVENLGSLGSFKRSGSATTPGETQMV